MISARIVFRCLLGGCAFTTAALGTPEAFASNSTGIPNFRLTDQQGKSHELYRLVDSCAVVVFTINEAALNREHGAELEEIAGTYGARGVSFLGLDPDTADTREAVAKKTITAGMRLPILMDDSQTVARALGCAQMDEALIMAPAADWAVIYRCAASKAALAQALDSMLDSHLSATPPLAAGQEIRYAAARRSISYARDVAPILAARCASCHRADGVAPFAMTGVQKVRGWSDMIRETVLTQRMPPWHADPHFGAYRNDRGITSAEKTTLLAWIDAGAPADPATPDPLENAVAAPAGEWALGTPDAVISMAQPEEIPAEGIVPYRYRYLPSGFTEDKWVRGLEVKAGNAKVVHHALVFIIYPKEYRLRQPQSRAGLGGYFASFLPGSPILPFPEGTAQWVPAGSTFVFQMHYTTTGKPETDQTRMALYFRNDPPAEEYTIEAANTTDFVIPAQAEDTEAASEYVFKKGAKIWGLSPHMHYRGARFEFQVRYPDGNVVVPLNVPHYDFDWQPMYLLKDPLALPAGAAVACVGGFDNSRFNPKNPNPAKEVTFGEQSFEEMFIGYIACSTPRDDKPPAPLDRAKLATMGLGAPLTEANLTGTKWRIGGKLVFEFREHGQLLISGLIPGTWKISGNNVIATNPIEPMDLGIVGDELFFNTRALRYLKTGNEPIEPWEQRSGKSGGKGINRSFLWNRILNNGLFSGTPKNG